MSLMWDSYTLSTHGDILFYPSISPMGGIDVYVPCSEAIGGVEHSSTGYVPGPSGKEKTLLRNISQDVKNNIPKSRNAQVSKLVVIYQCNLA